MMQTVFENSLMQHHVALPPDSMGKITYIAPAGQYSLKVCLIFFVMPHWSYPVTSFRSNQQFSYYVLFEFTMHLDNLDFNMYDGSYQAYVFPPAVVCINTYILGSPIVFFDMLVAIYVVSSN